MHDLSVSLFGSPQIRRGTQQVVIQRRKDLALLIYLIVTSQPHRRDTLAALLWQDQTDTEARSNLRKSLSRLKAILGDDFFDSSQQQVSINPSQPFELDIALFHSNIQKFHQHDHAHSMPLCKECLEALEQAAGFYTSDFLAGFSISDSTVFEEWQFFQTESLRKDLAEVLERLTLHYSLLEKYETAIAYCRRWLALDPLHEEVQRQLIRLYALSGQLAAAKRHFEEFKRTLKMELDADPEEMTLQLYADIQKKNFKSLRPDLKREESPPSKPSPGFRANIQNLPVPPAPFIGRENELREITHLLQEPSCRLLTLLGPGGSGKTRLALQVGKTLQESSVQLFADQISFIQLAPITEPHMILGAILQGLGITGHISGTDVREKLLSEIRSRQMLLILDNFEHLLGQESIELISELLSIAPYTKLLITSRERLNVEGEFVFPVEGLLTPEDGTPLSQENGVTLLPVFSALQLFEQCAKRVQPSFTITDQNYPFVAQICRNVQGMPLAIELAASWVQILPVEEIHHEIVRSLDFLQSDWRDLPTRQRSLRAVFDSSWNLLDKQSRPILKALSIFRASFTREAAQKVAGATAKTLLDLTSKSWIQRLSNDRFQIHELLRQFAFEKLQDETTTFEWVRKQYCDYYAAFCAFFWDAMKGRDQQKAFLVVETEFENIYQAWSWLISMGRFDRAIQNILPVLFHSSEVRGKTNELVNLLDHAIKALGSDQSDPIQQKHEIILRTAKGAFFQDGHPIRYSIHDAVFPINTVSIQQAWDMAQKRGNWEELGFWGILLPYLYGRLIDLQAGEKQLKQIIPLLEHSFKPWDHASAYLYLLKLMIPNQKHTLPEHKKMTLYLSQARDTFISLGDEINVGHTLSLWGNLKYQGQDLEGAIEKWQLAQNSFLAVGEWWMTAHIYWLLCDAYLQLGDFEKAFDACQEITATCLAHGLRIQAVGSLSKESYEKVRHGNLEEALELRKRCLAIITEAGVDYQIGWNDWEMGETLRVMGDLEKAAEWYERSYPMFDREHDNIGRSFYFRGLGDIALARQDYELAQQNFSKSLALAKAGNHNWMISYASSKLAAATLGMHDIHTAKTNIREALRSTMKAIDKGIALVALLEYAVLCRAQGNLEKAVEMSSLVHNHFASWHETRKYASILLATLKLEVPIAVYEQAHQAGCQLDVWDTVRNAIGDLEEKAHASLSKKRTKS